MYAQPPQAQAGGNFQQGLAVLLRIWSPLLAGHDTTASAMAWALYWIHQQPQVREKLLQELDSLGDFLDPMSIVQMPYLSAVCNETLRIHPVAMLTFPRVVQEPVELLGHQLETGTFVIGCIYLLH